MSEIVGNKRIAEAVATLLALHDKDLIPAHREVFIKSLDGYTEKQVLIALNRCLKEIPRFPTVADVLSKIDDGHPGPEEAWAMIPKSEHESGLWTQEMSQAYFAGANLLLDDPISARMAFKESYTRLLSETRAFKRRPKWSITLGHDQRHRQAIARQAVDRECLPESEVAHLLENKPVAESLLMLAGLATKQLSGPALEKKPVSESEVRGQLAEFLNKSRANNESTTSQ